MLHGTIFSATGPANRLLEWRCKKTDDRHVRRNNLSKIRDLTLHAFEAGSKTCSAIIVQKIVRDPCYTASTSAQNRCAKIVVANRPV